MNKKKTKSKNKDKAEYKNSNPFISDSQINIFKIYDDIYFNPEQTTSVKC